MNSESASELRRLNPRVDLKLVDEALEIARMMKELGVKSDALSSLPPTDPYSTIDTERRVRVKIK